MKNSFWLGLITYGVGSLIMAMGVLFSLFVPDKPDQILYIVAFLLNITYFICSYLYGGMKKVIGAFLSSMGFLMFFPKFIFFAVANNQCFSIIFIALTIISEIASYDIIFLTN